MTYSFSNSRVWDGAKWITSSGVIGPNVSGTDILQICRDWSLVSVGENVTQGGTMTVNSNLLGSYEWVYKTSSQIVSSSNMSGWFSGRVDDVSSWVLVDGNLTINSGVLFTPPSRKLFTVIYVTGDLAVNGTISMSRRGANHSGTGISGGATTAADIRIATGTFSGVSNPQVSAAGGAGGVAAGPVANGNVGTAGTAGGTGGGGSGGCNSNNAANRSGAGSAGTSFSGGSGGGGLIVTSGIAINGDPGENNGGAGGDAICSGNSVGAPGTGNPGGTATAGCNQSGPGGEGTGGVLIVICEGNLSGAGSILAEGANNAPGIAFRTGGASGGGSVTVMFGTDSSSITPSAAGGIAAQTAGGTYGASGGAGTARKLAL